MGEEFSRPILLSVFFLIVQNDKKKMIDERVMGILCAPLEVIPQAIK